MTDNEFRERLSRLEEGAKHRDQQLIEIGSDVRALVADMNERRGREAVIRVTHVEDREDRWQTANWVRTALVSALPAGLWMGIYTAIYRLWTGDPQ